jgi:hypothetical protein
MNTSPPPPHHAGLRPISSLLDNVTKPIFKKRGFYEQRLITDWPLIVGQALSAQTIPQKIVSRMVKEEKEGILYVDALSSSAAMQLQFMAPLLIEKIAVYFGYKAVTALKIQQKPSQPLLPEKKQEVMLSAEENQLLAGLTGDIVDEELQHALQELGKYILKNK